MPRSRLICNHLGVVLGRQGSHAPSVSIVLWRTTLDGVHRHKWRLQVLALFAANPEDGRSMGGESYTRHFTSFRAGYADYLTLMSKLKRRMRTIGRVRNTNGALAQVFDVMYPYMTQGPTREQYTFHRETPARTVESYHEESSTYSEEEFA